MGQTGKGPASLTVAPAAKTANAMAEQAAASEPGEDRRS